MERHPMFMDWKLNIIKMAILTQSGLMIWGNSYQNSNRFFWHWRTNPQLTWNPKGLQTAKTILKKKNKSWKTHTSQLQKKEQSIQQIVLGH